MSDAVGLMERVRRGDAGAFETLYDEYHRLVYGVALRVLSDPAGAEDVTQSVFMKLWSNPASFVSGSFGSWIVRVARNRAVDALRARGTRLEDEIPAELAESGSLEDTAFEALNAESVRNAIVQLPAEQRELIEMGFFGGVTHHEIAQKTGLPLGTVKTRIRAGLRHLRNALDGAIAR
jgi:RNA polymerase sigma-70 factor, ECF subfamily